MSEQERRLLKRRQAIEPIIGHLKGEHRMGRCYLKGELGDSINAVLAAAGYNIRWLLRQIVKKGLAFLEGAFLRLLRAMGMQPNGLRRLCTWLGFVPGAASSAVRA